MVGPPIKSSELIEKLSEVILYLAKSPKKIQLRAESERKIALEK